MKYIRLCGVLVLVLATLAACQPAQDVSTRALQDTQVRELRVQHDLTVDGVYYGAASQVFEGATANDYETTFAITDPTADRTITFPNSTGTVALNPYGASIEFEGATADDYETTLAVVDPTTIDKTITLPNVTGTVHVDEATQSLIAADAVVGGGGWSTGCTTTGAGALTCSGTIAGQGAVTGNTATITSTTTLNGNVYMGGGGWDTGCTVSSAGALTCTGTVAGQGALTANTAVITGTVSTGALTSASDMTLTPDSTGGNLGAKTEYSGLPRIKLLGLAQGTNPGSQTISLFDDTPTGEYAPVDADVTEANTTAYVKYGTNAYSAAFAVTAAAGDGIVGSNVAAGAQYDDMESAGLWVYSTATWAAGDLTLVLTDDGGARTYSIPALTTANKWTWLEVDISAGDLSAVSDVSILLSAQGETALGAFTVYIDQLWVWDALDEDALGTAILQDGVLSVVNVEAGTTLAEGTDYIVHYESGNDFIVYITDQSTADIAALVAY